MKEAKKHVIKLKEGALEELVKERHPEADDVTICYVLCDIVGMSYSQIYRIRQNKSKIGSDFIANILAKNPQKHFDDLFFVS